MKPSHNINYCSKIQDWKKGVVLFRDTQTQEVYSNNHVIGMVSCQRTRALVSVCVFV